MKEIVRMQFGSHVYGCNIPTSDTDIKVIYIPTPKELLMTKGEKIVNSHTEELDFEAFPLREFIHDAMNGQTYALDMLFTPPERMYNTSKIWMDIQVNKKRLLSQNVKPMVGYAKAQAMKYSLKGSRLAAVNQMIDLLEKHHDKKISDLTLIIKVHYLSPYIKFLDIQGPKEMESHLEIIGKYFPLTSSVLYVLDKLRTIKGKYGDRAQEAELNKGLDYKALYHAIRVGDEANELLTTGKITFPRPNAALLLKVRHGQLSFDEISQIIDNNYKQIEESVKHTKLPVKPDKEFWDKFVYNVYLQECKKEN